MITRRHFLHIASVATTASFMVPRIAQHSVVDSAMGKRVLCTITYNIRGCLGSQDIDADPNLVRIARPQMPARISMELALYEPDIVTFQEAPDESLVAQIAEQLNMNYIFSRGVSVAPVPY